MSCFWDGLIRRLNDEDFALLKLDKKPNAKQFASQLKNLNTLGTNIQWNNEPLRKQFIKECFQSVNEYDPNTVNSGYYCSSCDPFLILLCELLKISITHSYNGHIVTYTHNASRKTITCSSSKSHFS